MTDTSSKSNTNPTTIPPTISTTIPPTIPPTLSFTDALYYGLGNPLFFGQLGARMEKFNNSTDMPLLIFTSYIPFGDLFTLLYLSLTNTSLKTPLNSFYKKTSFIDKTIMIPIMFKILMVCFDIDNPDTNTMYKIIVYFILILILFLNNINKMNQTCDHPQYNNISLIGKSIIDTTITFCFTELLTVFIPYIMSNTSIGDIFNDVLPEGTKIRNIVIWSLCYVVISTHINYYNNIDSDRYCKTPTVGYNTDGLPFMLFLITYLFFMNFQKSN